MGPTDGALGVADPGCTAGALDTGLGIAHDERDPGGPAAPDVGGPDGGVSGAAEGAVARGAFERREGSSSCRSWDVSSETLRSRRLSSARSTSLPTRQ